MIQYTKEYVDGLHAKIEALQQFRKDVLAIFPEAQKRADEMRGVVASEDHPR